MDQSTLFNIHTEQYGEILETHAMWQCIAALGVKPVKVGNRWFLRYGENDRRDIIGVGSTVYDAVRDFYQSIKKVSASGEM